MDLRWLARALGHRNYRLYFFGQGVSLVGTWMQQVAMVWLVYRLSDSAFLLGLVGFMGQAPAFLLAPVAGVFSDRWNRRRTLLVTQSLAMLQAALLAVLTLLGIVRVEHVLVLAGLLGIVNAFDMPTRQAFIVDIVDRREDLPGAIALNSSIFNAARLVGPSVAGVLISVLGEWLCFLLNAGSYLAVIAALAAMQLRATSTPPPSTRLVEGFWEGLRYTFGFPPIRAILTLLGLISLSGAPLAVLLPVYATTILRGDATTLGLLTGAMGIGAIGGAIYLAGRKTILGLGRQLALMAAVFGLSMIGLSLARTFLGCLTTLLIAGFAMVVHMGACNTILQTIVDEDKRGRVMAFYSMAFLGMAPIGSLLAGAVAGQFGAPVAMALGGIACFGGAAFFAFQLPSLRAIVRPIYRRAGILPPLPATLQPGTSWGIPPED